jgi:hypothetical protein
MHSLCNKNQLGIFELTQSECGIFARGNLVSEIDRCEFSRTYTWANAPTLKPRIARRTEQKGGTERAALWLGHLRKWIPELLR